MPSGLWSELLVHLDPRGIAMLRTAALLLISTSLTQAQLTPSKPSDYEAIIQFRAKRDELKNAKPVRPEPLPCEPDRELRNRKIHGKAADLPDLRTGLSRLACP